MHILDGEAGAVYQPFGPRERNTHGPGSHFAYTSSEQYEVTWFDEMGDTLHVITRGVQGPELTPDEHDRGEEVLDIRVERWGATRADVPFAVPDRKAPLLDIFFDQTGRLWVQRSVAEGAPNEADVYNQQGELVQVVQWPRGIDLKFGWIDEDTILGIGSTEEGAPQVVRMQY